MTLPKFEYMAPETIEEACALLRERKESAKVMAGGTDLLIKLRYRFLTPEVIIGLKKIAGLDRIAFNPSEGLTIGATALLADVASHPDILKHYPSVAYAASETANTQVRNRGTVVGNLCNAAPSADNAPILLAMAAEVAVTGPEGMRRLPLNEFFMGPGLTVLEPGEIVTSIHVPTPPSQSGTSYQHISPRGKVDIAAAGAAVMVIMEGKRCLEARIALGAVFPTPVRASKTEDMIRGKELTPALIEGAGVQAAEESRPISDLRAGAEYRRRMVKVLTRRALDEAARRAARH